jgi:hypothetical protein
MLGRADAALGGRKESPPQVARDFKKMQDCQVSQPSMPLIIDTLPDLAFLYYIK